MDRTLGKSNTFLNKFIVLYFSRLIRINHQSQNSLIFVVSVEIIRFLFGHSQVFCIFMIETLNDTQYGAVYSGLKQVFSQKALENFAIFKVISISWLVMQLLFIAAFFLKQQLQDRLSLVRIIYFMMKYSKISCELMFSIFGITFYGAIKRSDYFTIIVLVVQMLVALLLFKVTPIYQQKSMVESHDAYSHNPHLTVEIANLMFCVISFLGTLFMLLKVPAFFVTVFIIGWTVLQLVKLKTTGIYPYYQIITTHKLYVLGLCLQTTQILVQTLLHLTSLQMIRTNALSLILILTFFLYQGVRNFNQHLVEKSYFVNVGEMRTSQEFYLVLNSYYSALQNLQRGDNLSDICLIVSSIRRHHQNSCKDPQCYCNGDIELKDFLKHYLLNILIKLQDVFSTNHMVLLHIYNFKFHVYQYYIKIHQKLERLDKIKEMGSLELLLSMALKYKLKKWIDEKNKEHKVIRICLAIRLQKDMSILNDLIIDDIEVRYKKWNSFSKEISRIDEVRSMSNKELMNYIQIEKIKTQKWEDYKKSPIFSLILYFYFKRIALKNDNLAELEKNIKELNRKVKEEEINRSSLFTKYLFHHNACTIEFSIRQASLGVIINSSKSIYRVFGYSSKRIIGEHVTMLAPQFLAKQRNQTLKKWIDKGQDIQKISRVSEAICLHKQNFAFLSLQYFKVFTTADQITMITSFFIKNENSLILINQKGQLESYGKAMKPLLKHLPHKIECDLVFKNLKKKIANADFDQEKLQKTIIFNEAVTNQMISGKKLSQVSSNNTHELMSEKDNIQKDKKPSQIDQKKSQKSLRKKQSKPDFNKESKEFITQQTCEFDNVWKINFSYKKQKCGSQQFYRLEMKALQQIKNFDDYVSKNQEGRQMRSNNGDSDNSDKFVQHDDEMMEIGEQENSSMASFTSQLGYGISKLISHFTFILLNPNKLEDKRMKKKILLELGFTVILISMLSATLVINKFSLDEKTTQLKAKSNIDRTFHLLEVSTNHAFNMYQYRNDPVVQQIAISQLEWDTLTFQKELNRQFSSINEEVTPLNNQVLYDYLKTPTNWTFSTAKVYQCELLQFFKFNFYVFWNVRNNIAADPSSITTNTLPYKALAPNTIQLRIVRDYLTSITEVTLAKNDKFNTNYLIISMVFFVIFSCVFGLYLNNYKRFRFEQNENHIQLYQMIPVDVLISLTEYYGGYYKHYVVGKMRIDSFLDQQKHLFELQIEENVQTQQLSMNKVKLVGRSKYWYWISIVIIFLLLNGGNFIISYNMYLFNKEVEFFSKLSNYISSSESIILSRWIRVKAQYYFTTQNFNTTFIDSLLTRIDSLDVKFDTYATFDENWITQSDPTFRLQFNRLLTTSPCILNKDEYTPKQLAICNQEAVLSKNGIITFVNGFSRAMRNLLLQWKANFNKTMSQVDYLSTLTKMRQFDLVLTFHINTFNKINQKITQVYENGFNNEYQTYFVLFIFLILLLIGSLAWSFYSSLQDKVTLSYLFGYTLLFPAYALKQSKYLLKFIQNNLEFSEKH